MPILTKNSTYPHFPNANFNSSSLKYIWNSLACNKREISICLQDYKALNNSSINKFMHSTQPLTSTMVLLVHASEASWHFEVISFCCLAQMRGHLPPSSDSCFFQGFATTEDAFKPLEHLMIPMWNNTFKGLMQLLNAAATCKRMFYFYLCL